VDFLIGVVHPLAKIGREIMATSFSCFRLAACLLNGRDRPQCLRIAVAVAVASGGVPEWKLRLGEAREPNLIKCYHKTVPGAVIGPRSFRRTNYF